MEMECDRIPSKEEIVSQNYVLHEIAERGRWSFWMNAFVVKIYTNIRGINPIEYFPFDVTWDLQVPAIRKARYRCSFSDGSFIFTRESLLDLLVTTNLSR